MLLPANWFLSGLEHCVAGFDWMARWRGTFAKKPEHLLVGERGEMAAFFFLRRKGFCVVAERWNDSPLPGDIDLIAWRDDVLCFVEVKTRTQLEFATASSAVDRNKRRILRRLARHYLRHLPEPEEPGNLPPTRFDIVTVYELPGRPMEIRLIAGAFGWSERELV